MRGSGHMLAMSSMIPWRNCTIFFASQFVRLVVVVCSERPKHPMQMLLAVRIIFFTYLRRTFCGLYFALIQFHCVLLLLCCSAVFFSSSLLSSVKFSPFFLVGAISLDVIIIFIRCFTIVALAHERNDGHYKCHLDILLRMW